MFFLKLCSLCREIFRARMALSLNLLIFSLQFFSQIFLRTSKLVQGRGLCREVFRARLAHPALTDPALSLRSIQFAASFLSPSPAPFSNPSLILFLLLLILLLLLPLLFTSPVMPSFPAPSSGFLLCPHFFCLRFIRLELEWKCTRFAHLLRDV